MPDWELVTNVRVADAKAFALELSKFAAELLEKEESYVTISYQYNEVKTFGGTFDPGYTLRLVSLGNLTPDNTERFSKVISEWLCEKLGLPNNRGYIMFEDPGNSRVGYQGTTFATILGQP